MSTPLQFFGFERSDDGSFYFRFSAKTPKMRYYKIFSLTGVLGFSVGPKFLDIFFSSRDVVPDDIDEFFSIRSFEDSSCIVRISLDFLFAEL